MVQVIKSVFLLVLIYLLSGCSTNQSFSTTQRFDKVSKDAVLEATKEVFLSKDSDILIDSYRDGIKAIEIDSAIYGINGLSLHEYMIEVKQDENGTTAQLSITSQDPLDEDKSYVNVEYFHNFIWDDILDVLENNIENKYIDQRQEVREANKQRIKENLKNVDIQISKASKESILDFDEDIIKIEDIEFSEENVSDEMVDNAEDGINEKDDFEKKLDAIVNTVDEVEAP